MGNKTNKTNERIMLIIPIPQIVYKGIGQYIKLVLNHIGIQPAKNKDKL